jgi:two-component system NtrC family response regulator
MARILIVDDDAAFRSALAATLHSLSHEVLEASSGMQGLQCMREQAPDLAIVDYRMPDMDGLAMLRSRAESPHLQTIPMVMLTAFASGQNTIEAMKLGAFDHLTKPIGRQDLIDIIARVMQARPSATATPITASDEWLIGQSQAMREVQKRIGLAAASDAPVLITGETGTGKEVIARALHRASHRADGPFVAVNCAAIPSELIESELFGHRKGAFSGAVADRNGHIREADGGVLFLDEIGDMPLSMQAKLLRVLQEGEVMPLGASRTIKVNIRLVAATHRHLPDMVEHGDFRRDLFYRLNIIPIELPPLRARVADILALAEHFLSGPGGKRLSPDASQRLMHYAWPGNVRELKNVIERCKVLVRGDTIHATDLDALLDSAHAGSTPEQDWLEGDMATAVARLEKAMIERALAQAQGNRAEAARRLGIHRPLLYRKMRDYGLD